MLGEKPQIEHEFVVRAMPIRMSRYVSRNREGELPVCRSVGRSRLTGRADQTAMRRSMVRDIPAWIIALPVPGRRLAPAPTTRRCSCRGMPVRARLAHGCLGSKT